MPHSPAATEFAPYYGRYIDLVPAGDVVRMLETQIATTLAEFGAVGEERGGRPSAPGKWSLKQVVGHMADTERVFAYRAIRLARGDVTPLPGFEQDDYVRAGGFDARSLRSLLDELADVRRATVRLFDGLPAEAWERAGTASGFPVSANALAYIIAGHELHHLALARTQFA
jgi:DinB family protein